MRTLMPKYLLTVVLLGCSPSTEKVEFPALSEIVSAQKTGDITPIPEHSSKEFVLALIGEVRGELEPCGCPTLPYGGFSRRTTAIQELLSKNTVFQFDAGETLLKGFFSNKDSTSQDRALLIGELSKEMGVDVWTVGPSDLMAVGMETLKTMTGPPRISATWHNEDGERFFEPFIVLSKENIQIAVIGLSSHPTDPRLQYIKTKSAKETLEAVLPLIPSTVDMIIALGSMDDEEVLSVQTVFPEVSLFLTTEGAIYEEPRHRTGYSQIIEAPKQGRFIQSIYVRHTTPRNPLDNTLSETDWRTWLMVKDQPEHPLQKKIQRTGAENNLYFTELIPLSASYDPKERKESTAQEKIAQFSKSKIEASQKIAEQPTTPSEPGFAASGRCAQCHSAEMAKWSFSKHSRAWESLLKHPVKGSTQNPDCIGCHTTGFGQIGGFGEPTVTNIRKYKAVQCETCHGPLKGHPNNHTIQAIPITIETCIGCHDNANSPDFDFESYLQQATCQSR